MVLNEEQWIKELREKRIAYGISQGRLAVASGITREYLNKIESGKMKPSKELLNTLHKELARFNPEAPLIGLLLIKTTEYLGIDLYVLINKLPKFEPLVYIILFLLLSVVILGISYLISLTILKKKEF